MRKNSNQETVADLGWHEDDLADIEILEALEDGFSVDLDDEEVHNCVTAGKLNHIFLKRVNAGDPE